MTAIASSALNLATCTYHELSPASVRVSPFRILTDFADALRHYASTLDCSFRSPVRDLLSIYVFGAVLEMQEQEILDLDYLPTFTYQLLHTHFGWSGQEATRRMQALISACEEPDSLLAKISFQGARAFRTWWDQPTSLLGHDFARLVQETLEPRSARL